MSLFKHAMVSGINDALVDRGVVSWPNESVGFEVCSKIAADLSGPDMLPDGGLAKESALLIGERIKEASDTLIAEGYGPDASAVLRTKQAAAMDFTDRAAWVAEACMSKAAEEASLTSVGPNTAESAVQTDQHAALDQKNRPTNKYLTGVGRTMFPSGGVVGQQMLAPGAPNQAGRNSLTALDKQAAYKRAFSVTPSGHALDAAMARQSARDSLNEQMAADAYGDTHPILGVAQGSNPLRRGLRELSMRRDNYVAGKHEAGQNAYNPLGGLLTPSGMGRYGGQAAAAPAAEMETKQAFSLTSAGHELDAARARNMIDSLRGREQAYRDYDATNPHAARDSREKELDARRLEMQARGLSYDARKHEAGRNAYNPLGGMLTPSRLAESGFLTDKQANEDMAAGDLGGAAGEEPGRLERAMMFLRGLKNKLPGFRPSPEAQVAAAGLGEAGTPGMEVMAHVLDTVKTAADAEDVLQQILHHQGEAGELATPELVEAIEHMMAHGESPEAEETKEAAFYEECLKIASDESAPPGLRERARKLVTENAGKALEYAKNNKLRTAGGALATVGAAYGGKKLYDKLKNRGGQAEETKEAAFYEECLKIASDESAPPGLRERARKLVTENAGKALEYAKNNKLRTAGGALATVGAAYGGKKLYDKLKNRGGQAEETKEAGVMSTLRNAAKLPETARRAYQMRGSTVEGQAHNAVQALKSSLKATGKVVGGAAATAGAAYGAKKLHDRMSRSEEPTEESKEAALYAYLKAAAEGSLTDVGENTEESAAHTDSVAELDMKNRAPGAYLAGVGNTQMPNKGQVYAVEPAHQDSPVHTDNLPTNETKSAELAYVSNFRKIASELGPYLPATMDRDEKVAHLQALMGMPPSERSGYLKALRAG